MKGLIDKESGTSLPRLIERLLDQNQAGELRLRSLLEGKSATIVLGADAVERVAFGTLMGDAAMREIQFHPSWEFEFSAVQASSKPSEPLVRPRVVKSSGTTTKVPRIEPIQAPVVPEDDAAFIRFAVERGTYTGGHVEGEDAGYLEADFQFLVNQVNSVGRALGLSHPRQLVLVEESPSRAVGYRVQNQGFSGVFAKSAVTAGEILRAL